METVGFPGAATLRGVNPGNILKDALTKLIRADAENFRCYASPYRFKCDRLNCVWRNGCTNAVQNQARGNEDRSHNLALS